MEKYILLFIFGFLLINSIQFKKETIIGLFLLTLFGGYFYYNQRYTEPLVNDHQLVEYEKYGKSTIVSIIKQIQDFDKMSQVFDKRHYENLFDLKKDIVNALLGFTMNINNERDEDRFIKHIKKIKGDLELKIKNNFNYNKDILLVHPDDPLPMNHYKHRDFLSKH